MSDSKHPEPAVVIPDSDRMMRLLRSCVLLLLAGFIFFSRTIAVPALAAVLVSIALFPVVNGAARLGIPRALAAVLALLAVVATSSGIVYAVREPLAQLGARGPELMATWQRLLANATGRNIGPATARQESATALVDVLTPLAAHVTTSLVAVGTSLILSYFILTFGTSVGRAVLAASRDRSNRRSWLRVCGSIRRHAAHYLQLVTAINIVFGVVTGLVLTWLGVKDAAAYGVIAGLMNFVPIVGALLTTCIIAAGGIAEHGPTAAVMIPAAVFLTLHLLESQFVTPMLLGRKLQLNPLIVIVGVLGGAAAWGVGGSFLAVPILISVKVACDSHPNFRRWGQVLGRGALVDFEPDRKRLARQRLRRATRSRVALSKS
jgi:predicted PurR-regulated permease PerM